MAHIEYSPSNNKTDEAQDVGRAPKSPDLDPVEMLRSILDKNLAPKPIYSKLALQDRLQQEWNNIDKSLCLKLIDSMSEKIQRCLQAKGGHFLRLTYFL